MKIVWVFLRVIACRFRRQLRLFKYHRPSTIYLTIGVEFSWSGRFTLIVSFTCMYLEWLKKIAIHEKLADHEVYSQMCLYNQKGAKLCRRISPTSIKVRNTESLSKNKYPHKYSGIVISKISKGNMVRQITFIIGVGGCDWLAALGTRAIPYNKETWLDWLDFNLSSSCPRGTWMSKASEGVETGIHGQELVDVFPVWLRKMGLMLHIPSHLFNRWFTLDLLGAFRSFGSCRSYRSFGFVWII